MYLKQNLFHSRSQCLLQSTPQNVWLVIVSLVSAGLMLSLKRVTIWVQGHFGNASLCDVFVACILSSISRPNVSLFETIKRESALSSGCVRVPSAEVQGRTRPDVQEWMYLDRKIKRLIFHHCSSKCWESNRKDGFIWYEYEKMSGMTLFSLCVCVCVFAYGHDVACVWL